MKRGSMCKFITEETISKIDVKYFVKETGEDLTGKSYRLNVHRAILISKGSGCFEIDGIKLSFSKGMLIFVFKGEEILFCENNDCQYIYIAFDGGRALELFRRFSLSKGNRVFTGFENLIPLWSDSISRADDFDTDLAAESMLLYAFSRLSKKVDKSNALINKILEKTEEAFDEPDFSIGYLSEELGYNSKYLSHIFKEKMHVSFSEYLRTMRIKHAVTLFDHGIDSVKNVAFLCGYTDPLYFSNVFKKEVGMSPKEYKNKIEK